MLRVDIAFDVVKCASTAASPDLVSARRRAYFEVSVVSTLIVQYFT